MKSKTSLLDRAILFNDFKSFGWLGLVYLLGLLFAVPFNLYLLYNSTIKNGYLHPNYLNVFAFNSSSSPYLMALTIVVPVLTGLFLFRYLQHSKSSDMVHALPIKRETLYNTHVLAGLIFLFVPLLITALISWVMIAGLQIQHLSGQDVLVWLAMSLIFNLIFFMTSVAIGMITGMSTLQGVLSYIVLLLPTGLSVLILHNMSIYTYGFAYDYYIENTFSRISEFYQYPIHTSEIIAYILISILLYSLGRYLYQRRQLERAGDALAFDILYPLFKYGVTFCAMLLLGTYLYSEFNSLAWTYFAYLLGSLLAYFLMEILFKKTFYVFNLQTFKGYGIFALTIIVLIAALQIDCTGYEQRIPALDEIESVYLDSYFYPLIYQETHDNYALQYEGNEVSYPPIKSIYKDQANINAIHALQQRIITNRGQEKDRLADKGQALSESVCLAYTLKNGDHIYRQYHFTPGKYDQQMQAISESSEYKKFHNDILRVDPANVYLIQIQADQMDRMVNVSEPEQIRQAIRILQNEVINQSYAEMNDHRNPWANIMIRTKDRHLVHLSWNKSFADFDGWLKKSGKYDQIRLIPERDLAYAVIAPNTENLKSKVANRFQSTRLGPQEIAAWEKAAGHRKITDPQQLEQCLQKYTQDEQQDYKILFVLKNSTAFYGNLAEADLPDSV